MGPPMWPWCCGLTARPVSGVEWSGQVSENSCKEIVILKIYYHLLNAADSLKQCCTLSVFTCIAYF